MSTTLRCSENIIFKENSLALNSTQVFTSFRSLGARFRLFCCCCCCCRCFRASKFWLVVERYRPASAAFYGPSPSESSVRRRRRRRRPSPPPAERRRRRRAESAHVAPAYGVSASEAPGHNFAPPNPREPCAERTHSVLLRSVTK